MNKGPEAYMRNLFMIMILTFLAIPKASEAILIEQTLITGKVKSFNSKKVIIIDDYKQKYTFKREDISKDVKLRIGKTITVPIKIKASDLFSYEYRVKRKKGKMPMIMAKKLHKTYTKFLLISDINSRKNGKYKGYENSRAVTSILDLFIAEAMADPEVGTCFYGGWPSLPRSGNRCRPPWHDQTKEAVGEGSPLRYNNCGAPNVVRCNPAVFGPGAATPTIAEGSEDSRVHIGDAQPAYAGSSVNVHPTENPEYGICVATREHDDFVSACTEASRNNFPQIIANLAEGDNTAAFENMETMVEQYCRVPANRNEEACEFLAEQLAAIRFAQQSDGREQRGECRYPASGNHNTLNNSLGTAAGSCNVGENGACFVNAECQLAAGAEGASDNFVPVTAVCSCSQLYDGAASATQPDAIHIQNCVNDTSVGVLVPQAEGSPVAAPEGADET